VTHPLPELEKSDQQEKNHNPMFTQPD